MKVASDRTCTIGGQTFNYAKLTRPFEHAFTTFHAECEAKLKESIENKESYINTAYGKRPAYDRYEYLVDLLKFVLTGPLDTIKAEDIDQAEAEVAVMGFFPESRRLALMLAGF